MKNREALSARNSSAADRALNEGRPAETIPSEKKTARSVFFKLGIAAGAVCLNYAETLKADCPVREGDVLSLRGAGKGKITGLGGSSRKGRQYVYAERYR